MPQTFKMSKLTEPSAAVRVFVLHDDTVDNLAELFKVSLQAFVGCSVVQTSDENFAKDFTFRFSWALLTFGCGFLDVDGGVVEAVRSGRETGIGLFNRGEGDEAESTGNKINYVNVDFKMWPLYRSKALIC